MQSKSIFIFCLSYNACKNILYKKKVSYKLCWVYSIAVLLSYIFVYIEYHLKWKKKSLNVRNSFNEFLVL